MFDDGCSTDTSVAQHALEVRVARLYQELLTLEPDERPEALTLCRDSITRYLHGGLGKLSAGYASLDASKPWICYWVLHSLALLGADWPDSITQQDVISFLSTCQHPTGGFGGGVGQIAHLAPTYAAVCSLATIGTPAAFSCLHKQQLHDFLLRMAVTADQGGGFTMHEGGEADLRACFTAMAVASMTGTDLQQLAAAADMVSYIRACQTYEGGLGGEPGNEAHGGYTFCGVAALLLLGRPDVLNVPLLLHWAVQRQGYVEGGFNGRTNKLVDGCYSFWQGGLFPLLQRLGPEYLRQTKVHRGWALSPSLSSEAAAGRAPAGSSNPPQHQAEQHKEQEPHVLVVPELPDLRGVRPPLQQALAAAAALRDELERVTAAAERAAAAAQEGLLASSARGVASNTATGGAAEPATSSAAADAAAAVLESPADLGTWLQPAQDVLQALTDAEQQVDVTQASAVELLPPWPSEAGPAAAAAAAAPSSTQAATGAGTTSAGGESQALDSSSSGSNPSGLASPLLFNSPALQLWLLKACQTMTGMRDKPGKPPDYYHTCYCLSGLSAAQHAPGSSVLGGEDNLLQTADVLVNVVEDKVAAIREFFARQ